MGNCIVKSLKLKLFSVFNVLHTMSVYYPLEIVIGELMKSFGWIEHRNFEI